MGKGKWAKGKPELFARCPWNSQSLNKIARENAAMDLTLTW